MNDPQAPLEIEVTQVPERACAGDRIPLVVLLRRPNQCTDSVRLVNLASRDKDVHLDIDLLERDVEIRPGETYCVTVPIVVSQPRVFALDSLRLQLEGHDRMLPFPAQQVHIQPALHQQIAIQIETLCPYEEGMKVQLTFEHKGQGSFSALTIALEPAGAVHAGKRILRRAAFNFGDREQIEAVVAASQLTIVLRALVDGQEVESRVCKEVPPLEQRERSTFRFLEPRRLSLDQVQVNRPGRDGPRTLAPVQAAFPFQGGEEYEIVVQPQNAAAQAIEMKEITGLVQINKTENDPAKRLWKFLIEVSFNDLWSKPKRLFYNVQSPGEKLTGEIHLRLKPAWGRHLLFALALGVAITLQGIYALGKILLKSDSPLEIFAGFRWADDYQVLFLLFIPLIWLILRICDRVQYRFRTE